ncbi:MAG: hypothetical protein MSJ26_07310 [Oscillospiraceae bacterium]|nr:hypothetical protein [Oscillospiraceae bacterium]
MAQNIPFGYAPRGMEQQRPVSGNMRYNAMGMGPARPQPVPDNRQQRQSSVPKTEAPKTAQAAPPHSPEKPPQKGNPPQKNPLAMLGINGLDEEKLILIVLIIMLAKSGADWVILAALIYIMM